MHREGSPVALTKKSRLSRKLAAAMRFPYLRVTGHPILVNLEVTKMCNARCDFCDYWKTGSEDRLDDFAPVIERLKPTVVMITGGEPLLRRDLDSIVRGIRTAAPSVYLGMITHGAMLSARRAVPLWEADLDQISISVDFLDERHDRARGIPGLTNRIKATVPRLLAAGIDNLGFNTVIKRDNLDAIVDMVHWVADNGVKISFSTYADVKVGNRDHNVSADEMAQLRHVIEELLKLKAQGYPIMSSSYYLGRIPEFFDKGGIPNCIAGQKFVTVTPSGHVKRCSEFPVEMHYTEWTPKKFGKTHCDVCWFSCRGETQAPYLSIERLRQSITV